MKTKTIASLALISTLLATPALAAENPNWPNWYVGLGIGANFTPDADLTVGAVGSEVQADTGYQLSIALGYAPATTMAFFQNTRWELEYTYRSADLDSVGGVSTTGQVDSHSAFFNMYYDFNNSTRLTPYVGGGVGITNVEADLGPTTTVDDDVAAWQLMAGLGYAPESIPSTVWTLGYRYHATFEDAKFTTAGFPSEMEYSNHSVEAGGRFRF